ncbi:hypothetical protein F5I97DRAFT_1045041 [Phlebopus sp. FC_14]|nr:hypothetical protein F5I97DRAFT_1045041 [Phlebopus sp. FC_14]
MSSSFPQVRRRQPNSGVGAWSNRDSNAVRASVLETALELGIAQNSTVANWIFNTPLAEVPEDVLELHGNPEPEAEVEESQTPALTCGSNTTSDESSSLNSPRNNNSSAGVSGLQAHTRKPSATEPPHVHFEDFSSDQLQLFSPLTLSPRSPAPSNASKVSGDLPSSAEVGCSSEGHSLSKGKGGKQEKKAKKSKPKALDLSKSEGRETDYTSDGGYLSASSNKSQGKSPSKGKSRAIAFFRRRPKKSQRGSDDEDDNGIPPVPAIPAIPRPSSPKPLRYHGTAPSPTRTGFTSLTLNFSSPPASPPRRTSKSPPPPHMAAVPSSSPPRRSKDLSHPLHSPSFVPASASAASTFNPAAATLEVPSSPDSRSSLQRLRLPPLGIIISYLHQPRRRLSLHPNHPLHSHRRRPGGRFQRLPQRQRR